MSETFLILNRIKSNKIKNMYLSSYKIPINCYVFMKLEFSQHIFDKFSNIQYMKIRLVGVKLFHVDIWTDRQT